MIINEITNIFCFFMNYSGSGLKNPNTGKSEFYPRHALSWKNLKNSITEAALKSMYLQFDLFPRYRNFDI